ncbi:MAG: DUF808 domain-containing protein, partial [Actinomycetes bacterium]
MLGGLYLSYEGAEKLWEKVSGHDKHHPTTPAPIQGPDQEKVMTAGAIRTDFILSAEIMVIALNEVADEPLLSRALILFAVALVITLAVYGVVALIVKMDDIGLHLVESGRGPALGNALVHGMPKLLAALSIIGTIAMLWVGGHILLVGFDTLGWHLPYGWLHHLEEDVAQATGPVGGVLGWLTNTFFSFLAGLLVGAVAVAVMHVIPRGRGHGSPDGHEVSQRPTQEGAAQGNAAGEIAARQDAEEERGD